MFLGFVYDHLKNDVKHNDIVIVTVAMSIFHPPRADSTSE